MAPSGTGRSQAPVSCTTNAIRQESRGTYSALRPASLGDERDYGFGFCKCTDFSDQPILISVCLGSRRSVHRRCSTLKPCLRPLAAQLARLVIIAASLPKTFFGGRLQ